MYFLKNVILLTIIDMQHINHNLLIFRPDFDASREKLRKLGDAEGTLTKEEFNKMKQELEAEYLATFKKTVAMHETFLCRLARCVLTIICSIDIFREVLIKVLSQKAYIFEVQITFALGTSSSGQKAACKFLRKVHK